MPKNEVHFKLHFEAKQEAGHYQKIKFNWFEPVPGAGPDEKPLKMEETDTGFFRDWKLIQIEGEEPAPAEEVVVDPKAKKKPPPKADPKKGGALEEITDNRPRIISFTKDFGPEELAQPIRINEAIANHLAALEMEIQVIDVNRETQEETLTETLRIDLSCLLFPSQAFEYEWEYDRLKAMPIHYLKVKISADKGLLSEFLRKKLNPCQLTVVAAKNVPYKVEPRFKPIYMVCKFIDE